MDETTKTDATLTESEPIFDEDSAQLFTTMQRRSLTDAEARMISERSKWYHFRKIIRRVIETLPVIITAIGGVLSALA